MATTYLGRFHTSLSIWIAGKYASFKGETRNTQDQAKNPLIVINAPVVARRYVPEMETTIEVNREQHSVQSQVGSISRAVLHREQEDPESDMKRDRHPSQRVSETAKGLQREQQRTHPQQNGGAVQQPMRSLIVKNTNVESIGYDQEPKHPAAGDLRAVGD
jgi:hypothetical protein